MNIGKDSRGYLWIGSSEGVFQFNGIEVKHRPSAKDSMIGEVITSDFFEDQQSNIWFSTYNAIHCYKRSENRIIPYQLKLEPGDSLHLEQDYIVFYLEKEKKKLWLRAGNEKTGKWIFVMDLDNPGAYKKLPFKTAGTRFSVSLSTSGEVKKIYACPWVETNGVEIHTLKNTAWQTLKCLDQGGNSFGISNAFSLNDSTVWLLSTRDGLLKLNPNQIGKIEKYLPPGLEIMNCSKGQLLDSALLYIATQGAGLFLFDLVSESFIDHWMYSKEDASGLTSNNLIGLYIDDEKRLWLAHLNAGVSLSQPLMNKIENPIPAPVNIQSKATFIVEDSVESIWMTTVGQGIFRFRQSGEILNHFTYASIGLKDIQHVSCDQSGMLWVMGRNAIFTFNDRQGWNKVYDTDSLTMFFLQHAHSGRKLLLTNQGIKNLIPLANQFSIAPAKEFLNVQGLHFLTIFDLDGKLLIPYDDQELWIYENDADSLVLKDTKLSNASIYCAVSSVTGDTTWLGTSDGLKFFANKSRIQSVFKNDWEIGSQKIAGLRIDDSGRLWISTNDGLWSYYKNILLRYGQMDGFENIEFSTAFLKSKSGALWLGHQNGVAVFHPDSIKLYSYPPKPYIEEMKVNNEPYKGSKSIGESNSITLKYFEQSLSFRIVAIGHFYPELSKIEYQLTNNDAVIISPLSCVGNGEWIPFPRLSSGNYTLIYKAINCNGIKSKSKYLKIRINAPFYFSWWFVLLCLLFISLVNWLIIWSIHQRKEHIQRIKSEDRQRIAQDMHDDLGTGLSALKLHAESLARKIPFSEEKGRLEKIIKTANSLSEKINEIIWMFSNSNDYLDTLIDYLHQYASDLFEPVDINCFISLPDEIPETKIEGNIRQMIVLSFKEILNNILKHASAKKVQITVALHHNILFIVVKDNGVGIDPDLLINSRGNGLPNIRERISKIGGVCNMQTSSAGTTIAISVPI